MLLHPGVLASLSVVNGLLFNSHLPGRLKAEIFAGLKQWLLNFLLTFLSQEVFMRPTYLCILTTKAPSALSIKAIVVIFMLIWLSTIHISPLWLYQSSSKLSTLSLMQIQLILSCAGNQDLLESRFSHLLSSLRSFLHAFLMPRLALLLPTALLSALTLMYSPLLRLDYPFKLATRVAEMTVGGTTSVPPCPTRHQNLFHPFKTCTTTPLTTPTPMPTLHSFPLTHSTSSLVQQVNPHILPSSPHIIKARKPQSGHQISQNVLCPHVPAADHLFSWDTPHAAHHRQHLITSLPSELAESATMSICGAYTPNTKSTYATGMLRFTQFCDK